jgi:hypothetical protein
MELPKKFNECGTLPPGDYELTIGDLISSILEVEMIRTKINRKR